MSAESLQLLALAFALLQITAFSFAHSINSAADRRHEELLKVLRRMNR